MSEETPQPLRLKPHEPPPLPVNGPPEAHDVTTMLRANLEKEKQRPINGILDLKRKPSRRLRDWAIVLVVSYTALGLGAIFSGFNVVSVMFAFGGIVIITCGVTWVMFQVMDRY